MDSKASTPFSQALRISKMAAEMLRQASCHFICLEREAKEGYHHRGWKQGVGRGSWDAPTTTPGQDLGH